MTKVNPNSTVETGSARASRAVFRALAENLMRTKKFRGFKPTSHAKALDARRVCSPDFGIQVLCRTQAPGAVSGGGGDFCDCSGGGT